MRLAIIVTEYPKTTETFILRDIMKFLEAGAEIRLFHIASYNHKEILHGFAAPTRELARHPGLLSRAGFAMMAVRPATMAACAGAILRRQVAEPVLMAKSLGLVLSGAGIAAELRAWGCDHIHAEFAGHPATAAWVAHRLTGIPYSVSCRAHDIFRTQRLLAEKLGEAAFVRTISNYARRFLQDRVPGLAGRELHVIHSSVDTAAIPALDPAPADPFHIVYVGSLQPRKGVDVLLRALAALPFDGWRCSIAGDGPDRAKLEAMAARMSFRGEVAFLGAQDFQAVGRLYASASVVAVPSVIGPGGRTEGIPNVAIEALAHRRPAISTNVSGIPELIQDGVTGRLIEPGDADALASAIAEIHADPEAAWRMACEGRRHVEHEFSLAVNAGRQFDLFRSHSAQSWETDR